MGCSFIDGILGGLGKGGGRAGTDVGGLFERESDVAATAAAERYRLRVNVSISYRCLASI